MDFHTFRGGGSTARLGGRELTLLCSFHQYRIETIVDSCTLMYYSLKLGGRCPPNAQVGGGGRPPCPPCGAPPYFVCEVIGDTVLTVRIYSANIMRVYISLWDIFG